MKRVCVPVPWTSLLSTLRDNRLSLERRKLKGRLIMQDQKIRVQTDQWPTEKTEKWGTKIWGLKIRNSACPPSACWHRIQRRVFSEREREFTFAICHRRSVCLPSVSLSSVTFVHPTQAIEIFGNVSTPCGTLAILRRSSQGNPFVGGLNPRGVAKYGDFGPFEGYISEMMQDMI